MNTKRSAERNHLDAPSARDRATSPYRDAFDLPASHCYLNTSFMAPLMHRVRHAAEAGLELRSTPWEITADDFFGPIERLRGLAAGLLGGAADDWAMIPAVSYGVETAALNLPVEAGQRIVVVDEQFPSNVYPWRAVAERVGATVETVQRPADDDWAAAIVATVRDDTAVVAIPAVHWTTGAAIDLAAVGDAARRHGAGFLVDATQAAGVMSIDAAAIDADFLLTAAYKYLLGPYGVCLMRVAPRQHGGRPLEHGWLNRERSDAFHRLTDYTDAYRPGARRFDQGERADGIHLGMAIAALEQLDAWGIHALADHARGLRDLAFERAAELDIGFPRPERASPMMLGLELPPGAPDDLAARLREEDIFVNARGSRIRFSLHAHNDAGDVYRFFDTLGPLLST